MSLEARNLPDGVKKQILSQIREQIGWSEYDKLVSALGEDGLIEMALRQLDNQAKETEEEAKSKEKQREKERWTWIIIICLVLLTGIGVRTPTWWQFLILAAFTVLSVIMLSATGMTAYDLLKTSNGCGELLKGLGSLIGANIFLIIWAFLMLIGVAYFVVTGDYEAASQVGCGFFSSCPTPTPISNP
jgi:uncharacterized ion transporter superfamily protein YfcC